MKDEAGSARRYLEDSDDGSPCSASRKIPWGSSPGHAISGNLMDTAMEFDHPGDECDDDPRSGRREDGHFRE